jgi:MFS transporter, SP family, sugar:H+ symporter
MCVCEFVIAAVGVAAGGHTAHLVLIVFVSFYIAHFASTWGPAAWTVSGEIFPLAIRAKGIALSTASNWLWNFIIAFVTPYIVDEDKGNLGEKVFFIWGSTCAACILFAYFCVYETKGWSLEEVNEMMNQCTARESSKWIPPNNEPRKNRDVEMAQTQNLEATPVLPRLPSDESRRSRPWSIFKRRTADVTSRSSSGSS